MEDNKALEEPIKVDYNDCFKYIVEKTGISQEIVETVIDAETDFLRELGIITDMEDPGFENQ